jgi:hypothetical protein
MAPGAKLTGYLALQHRALRSYCKWDERFAKAETLITYMNFPFSVPTTLMMMARIQSSSEPGLFTLLFQRATFRPAARGTLLCFFEGPTEPVRSRGGKVMETPRPWAMGPGVPAGDEALGRLLRLSAPKLSIPPTRLYASKTPTRSRSFRCPTQRHENA